MRRALALMGIATVFNQVDRYALFVLQDPIRRELALSDGQMGVLTGLSFALAYTLASVPAGRLSDRYDRTRLLAASIVVWAVGTIFFGLVSGFVMLLAARMMVAVGEAGGSVTIQSQIGDLVAPAKRAGALAIISFAGLVGASVGYIAPALIADAYGWRWSFVALGALTLCVAPLIWFALPEPQRGAADGVALAVSEHAVSTRKALAALFRRPAYVLALIGLAFAGIGAYGPAAWFPALLMRRFDLDLSEVGLILGLSAIGPSALGALVGGWLTTHLAKRDLRWQLWLPAICIGCCFIFAPVQMFSTTLVLVVAANAVPAFGVGLLVPALYASLHAMSGARLRGTGIAMSNFALLLVGQGASPFVTGVISSALAPRVGEADGLAWGMLAMSAGFAFAAVCFWGAAASFTSAKDSAHAFDEEARAD